MTTADLAQPAAESVVPAVTLFVLGAGNYSGNGLAIE
jgi:hypothetical protein